MILDGKTQSPVWLWLFVWNLHALHIPAWILSCFRSPNPKAIPPNVHWLLGPLGSVFDMMTPKITMMTDISRLQCKMKYIYSLYRTIYVLKIFNAGWLIILVYSCILNGLKRNCCFKHYVCGGGWPDLISFVVYCDDQYICNCVEPQGIHKSRQFSVADTGIANYTMINCSVTVVSLRPLKTSLLKRFVKVFHLTTVKHKEPQMQHRNDDRPIINQWNRTHILSEM